MAFDLFIADNSQQIDGQTDYVIAGPRDDSRLTEPEILRGYFEARDDDYFNIQSGVKDDTDCVQGKETCSHVSIWGKRKPFFRIPAFDIDLGDLWVWLPDCGYGDLGQRPPEPPVTGEPPVVG